MGIFCLFVFYSAVNVLLNHLQKVHSGLVQFGPSMMQSVWSNPVHFSPVWFFKLCFKLKSSSAPGFPAQEVS